MMTTEIGTRFPDAIRLWRLAPSRSVAEVIDAATDALVNGFDTPTLRVLAGASPKESHFVLDDLIVATVDELGLSELLEGEEQLGALKVMLLRMLEGQVTTRETARWAYTQIGYDGGPECDVFVNMDSFYDDANDHEEREREVDRWMRAEAEDLLAGRPSPGPPPSLRRSLPYQPGPIPRFVRFLRWLRRP